VPDENPSGLGAFDLPLRLPGQYFDKEANLHYNYHREYDPSIGRYVESDPMGLRAGLNTYGYVSGDALTRIDPMGLKAQICCKKIPRWWIPAAHCFVNEVSEASCCGSKTRRVGLQGPPPWGSSKYKDAGEVKTNDPFDNPKESNCSDWNTDCGVSGCIDAEIAKYPSPSVYGIVGSNSNTFAGTIARACNLAGPDDTWPTPGWHDDPAKSK